MSNQPQRPQSDPDLPDPGQPYEQPAKWWELPVYLGLIVGPIAGYVISRWLS